MQERYVAALVYRRGVTFTNEPLEITDSSWRDLL